jgi:hypothetical protein
MFTGEARSLPLSGAPESASLGYAPALSATYSWKGFARASILFIKLQPLFVNVTNKIECLSLAGLSSLV